MSGGSAGLVIAIGGLVVAVGALVVAFLSWRSAHSSARIARRALEISEAEHNQRERERSARARLAVDAEVVNFEPDEHRVLWLRGVRMLLVRIELTNTGDRNAGRTTVAVAFPLAVEKKEFIRWCNATEDMLPDDPERAARVGDSYVLRRTLAEVGRGLDETLFASAYVARTPLGEVVDFPLRVRVPAEGAEGETVVDLPLKLGRPP